MARKWFASWILIIMVVEGLSWLSYGYPSLRSMFTVVVLMIVLLAACYRLQWGIAAVLAELVVGSQGYLLAITGPVAISLRLGLFAVVGLATVVWIVRQRSVAVVQTRYWKWYLALVGVLSVAALTALWHGNTVSNIFLDANGYLFIAMILPFMQAIRTKQQIQQLFIAMLAGLTILAVQTTVILFIYSHSSTFAYYLYDLYRWLRDFRLAEITPLDNHFTRIFFQSHLYVLFAFILASAAIVLKYRTRWMTVLLGVATTLLFSSQSRSFWAAAGLITLGFLWRGQWQYLWRLILGFSVGFVIVLGVINLPIFGQGSNVDASSLLTDRTDDLTGDVGGGSRLALLGPLAQATLAHPLVGSGFGTTVTYASLDERSIATTTSGLYTTYSFEWGYLDLLLKLGWFGAALFVSIITAILLRLWYLYRQQSNSPDQLVLLTAGVGVLAVMVVHLLTPYLNHPLGLGWIVLATAIASVYDRSQS